MVVHSFRESDRLVWVACSECERGGNGTYADKCSCGGKVHRYNKHGCYCGIPIKYVNEHMPDKSHS